MWMDGWRGRLRDKSALEQDIMAGQLDKSIGDQKWTESTAGGNYASSVCLFLFLFSDLTYLIFSSLT